MAEVETKVEREGAADEESLVIEATVSETLEVKVSPVMSSDAQKEAAGSVANADPSAPLLEKVTEETPMEEGVEMDVQKKGSTPEKEKGKKVAVKRQKGSNPSKIAQRKLGRKRKNAAGNDGNTDPSESAVGKVEEIASEVMNVSGEDKAGEGDDSDGKGDDTKEVANKDDEGAEVVANKEKVDSTPSKKNKKWKKRNKARVAAAETAGTAAVGDVKKVADTKELAGMIFMCNSETKKDCYRYKIFGMPSGKKELVAKVNKGMKLFLYDIDLKLLYGIYVAASKGGYNIQSKAFKSGFPSQVRFKVFKDCLPLSQENFKAAIKTNYFKKNMFNCELSAEQVKKLTKLFIESSKASKLTNGRDTRKRLSQSSLPRDAKRRRHQGTSSRSLMDQEDRVFLYGRDAYASRRPLQVPFPAHGPAVPRQAPLPLYSSPPRVAPLPPPPPAYAYERARDVDYYRRELPMEAPGHRIIDSDMRPPYDHIGYSDAYGLHREPAPYHESRYPPASYYAPAPPPYRY